MSEPQRSSKPGATPGQEPGAGISDPATVDGGTLAAAEGAADPQRSDPGGYPHEPAESVPPVPADDPRPPA
jgi:hypothetical protein